MKRVLIVLGLLLVVGIVGVGVLMFGNKTRQVETDRFSQSFATESAEIQAEVQLALGAIKTRDFTVALTSLKKVAESGDLTDAQKLAISDTVTDITVILSENPPPNEDELFEMVADITDIVSY